MEALLRQRQTAPTGRAAAALLRRRWLALVNAAVGVFALLPWLAPVLLAAGWTGPASLIYSAYGLVCHQWAFRSYFLFGPELTYSFEQLRDGLGLAAAFAFQGSPDLGYKVAWCQRDAAIYLTLFLAGLVYAHHRGRVRPLGFVGFGLLVLPLALDGTTQLLGWRESTWALRTATGLLFAVGAVWFLYPRTDALLGVGAGEAAAGRATPPDRAEPGRDAVRSSAPAERS